MPDTDSEIMRRWKAWEIAAKDAKAGRFAPGAGTVDIVHEQLDLERAWEAILLRKKNGEMTDRTHMDAVRKVVSDIATISGMPIELRESPGERDKETRIAWDWNLTAVYAGSRGDYSESRWNRLIDLTYAETQLLQFVKPEEGPLVGWTTMRKELPDDYYQRDYGKPGAPWHPKDEYGEIIYPKRDAVEDSSVALLNPYARDSATWIIDVWVWQGPGS